MVKDILENQVSAQSARLVNSENIKYRALKQGGQGDHVIRTNSRGLDVSLNNEILSPRDILEFYFSSSEEDSWNNYSDWSNFSNWGNWPH